MLTPVVEALLPFVRLRAPERAVEWLTRALTTAQGFDVAFASVARRFGHAPLELDADEATRCDSLLATWVTGFDVRGSELLAGWPLSGLVRALLLSNVVALCPAAEAPQLVTRLFDKGDSWEREAVLRSLGLLPEPARFTALAIRACGSHVQSVFEAIACENPYPAVHFPDAALNQLVLKCFFTDVPLRRVVGLEGRRNLELSRMALGYASERRAAGRSVPADLASVVLPTAVTESAPSRAKD